MSLYFQHSTPSELCKYARFSPIRTNGHSKGILDYHNHIQAYHAVSHFKQDSWKDDEIDENFLNRGAMYVENKEKMPAPCFSSLEISPLSHCSSQTF